MNQHSQFGALSVRRFVFVFVSVSHLKRSYLLIDWGGQEVSHQKFLFAQRQAKVEHVLGR